MKPESQRARAAREEQERQSRCGHYAANPREALDMLLAKRDQLAALKASPQWADLGESGRFFLDDMDNKIEEVLAMLAMGCVQMEDRAVRYAKRGGAA